MIADWVAGCTRARVLARRRLTVPAARRVAAQPTLTAALDALSGSSYRRTVTGQSLGAAQHAVAATLLWDLRVLAGWLPRRGVDMLRRLCAAFEVANVDELAAGVMSGRAAEPFYELGSVATTWPRLREAGDMASLRRELSSSIWGDPGESTPAAIGLAMRARWLVRAQAVPPARTWIEGAAVLTYVGAAVCADTQIPHVVLSDLDRAAPGLAAARGGDHDLPSFRARLPPWLRDWLPEPVLAGDSDPDQAVWLAWGGWWRRIEAEGVALLRSGGFGPDPIIGAVAMLGADAWRVRAALSAAAYGGGSGDGKALETFDALA